MAAFFESNNCIKWYSYNLDTSKYEGGTRPLPKPTGNIIKWYNTTMTYAEKYFFGYLTPEEYAQWQKEMEAEARGEDPNESQVTGKTFWANDDGKRDNISSSDYKDFLAQSGVDISNSSTIDFEKLSAQVNGESAPAEAVKEEPVAETPQATAEPSMDEILANVNKDIHGGDKILSQEEIAALFAAAGV